LVIFVGLILLSPAGAFQALAGPSKDLANDTKDLFNEEMRTLRAENMFLPMSYLEVDGVSYGYFLPRLLIHMAHSGTEFRIRKIKTDDNILKVELETDRKARLKIYLFDPEKKVTSTLLDKVFPMMLSDVFNFGTPPDFPRIVVNTSSGLAHLGACNHLPEESLRLSFPNDKAAREAGHRLCPSCFPPDPPLPYSNYMPIRTAALEATRHFERAFPVVDDEALQQRVQKLGETLVKKLPFPEKGFSYRFRVVESEIMQAQSFPTGFVYLTDKLMDAVEDEAELAHILAHEITHCELHLPPNTQIPEPNIIKGDTWAEYYEKLRWHETEADLVAINTLSGLYPGKNSAAAAINILSKLQFANEAIPLMESRTYADHPPYGSRLEWLKNGYFPVSSPDYFEAVEKGGDWVCRARVLGGGVEENNGKVLYLLVQMSAGARKELEAVAKFVDDEFSISDRTAEEGTIVFAGGDDFEMEPRSGEKIKPGNMKILTLDILGLKGEKYGISTTENPISHDPANLKILNFSVPGKVKWVKVTAPDQ